MTPPIKDIFNTLHAHYGPLHWWPAESNLEMMIGAVLTQNTAWINVDQALNNMRLNNALDLKTLATISREQLIEWIRPAGFHNRKSKSIKGMIETIRDRFDNSIDELFKLQTEDLRKELISWQGVGPETADCILLYAAKRPAFVVDAYTNRICNRHGWISEKARYDDIAKLFTDHLPKNTQLFNEYHALIVQVCKDFCNTKPKCGDCPLKCYLPADHTG